MLINVFQEDSLHDFPRDQSEADQKVVLCIDPSAFFEDVCSICYAVVVGDLPALGWEVGGAGFFLNLSKKGKATSGIIKQLF